MKEAKNILKIDENEYPYVFNLNAMEEIQDEFGTVEKWGKLLYGKEPSIKAIISGMTAMINEGIEIENETAKTPISRLSKKQVGRIITKYGLDKITSDMLDLMMKSTENPEKNE